MKRREFFIKSASAAALLGLPVVNFSPKNSNLKTGILTQVFKAAGYESFENSDAVTHYSSFKQAYQDLLDSKIDVLVSSPAFFRQFKPELSLIEAQAPTQVTHSHFSNFHSQFGLKSELVSHLSPLKIRISNLSFEELSQWSSRKNAASVAAIGFDAVSFEHMGFHVRQEPSMLKLTMQLVELSQNHLNLTNAYSPALFLNAFKMNQSIGVYPCKAPLQNLVMIDDISKSLSAIELVYRGDSKLKEISEMRSSLQAYLQQDDVFQQDSLKAILEMPNFTFADKLPVELSKSITAYNDVYLSALTGKSSSDFNGFESLKGES